MGRLGFHSLLVICALASPVAVVADDAATRQLVEQGRFWEQREQPRRALEAWQRVLQADPANVEALSRLAVLSASTGDRAKAQTYYDRLNALAPGAPALAEARRALSAGPAGAGGDALVRARALAAAKDYPAAVAAYREALVGKTPEGPLGLEYYQTLGATADGWPAARDGLADLARSHPQEPRYALAYAQHLSYREASRRDGIDRLAELGQNPAAAAQARPAWRQALIWLQAQPADAPRYKRYLQIAGDDAAVREHLQGLSSRDDASAAAAVAAVQGNRVRDIFAQIERDDFDAAQSGIDRLLQQQPRSADGHGALGVLRLRQGDFAGAERNLRQAQSESPATAGRWRDALRAATFWLHIQSAQAARTGGDTATAASEYAAAFAQPPADAPDALRVAYADVLIERQQDTAAEKIDREVLRRSPDNPDALRGLITILARNGRQAEALQLADHAPAQVQDQLSGLRADQLRTRASAERSAGQLPQAQADLEQALLLDPDSPWIRLDLAAVLRAQGHPDQARSLLDGVAASNGDLPQVRMAQAYAAGNDNDWQRTLLILEQIDPAQRPADSYALQRRAWINYQLQRVQAALDLRRPAEGYAILDEASVAAGNDPELLAAVASGWARLGDTARAVGAMRRAIDRSPHAEPGMRIQYAALLLSAGQDGEFEVVADDIATRNIMTAPQQAELDTLVVGYRVKLADRARTAGNLAEAYVQLRDVIARYPDDARVQLALARLLAASGDTDQSTAIYQAQLKRTPDDDDVRLGLIDTRLAAGDQETARTLIKSGLRQHPQEPRYWQASGRLAESENRRGDALAAYTRAEQLKGTLVAAPAAAEPELAWLDPTHPDQALPKPVANALAQVAPSTGPLRPRASAVALPPSAPSAGGYTPAAFQTAASPPCQMPVAGQRIDLAGCRVGDTIVLRGVNFESRQASLTSGARNLLDLFADALKVRSDIKVEVDGHTDGNGSASYNQQLSERRAAAVRAYLVAQGIYAGRIDSRGFGASQPIADNTSDAGREANRRVEAKVVGEGAAGSAGRTEVVVYAPAAAAAPVVQTQSQPWLSFAMQIGIGQRSTAVAATLPTRSSVQLKTATQLSSEIASRSAGPYDNRLPAVDDNVGRLQAETSGWAGGALTVRSRAGQAGTSQLSDIEVPLQWRSRETRVGRLGFGLTPVYLDAGGASGADKLNYGSVAVFVGSNGTTVSNGIATVDASNVAVTSSAGGVAPNLYYNYGPLTADIGTTPLGFLEERLDGGIKLAVSPGNFRLALDLSRRAVTESLLSYAGEKDPFTGKDFGGVSRTGGRGDLTYDTGNLGLYVNAGFFTLDGHNVDSNTEITGGGGVYAKPVHTPTQELTYGLNLTAFGYDKNLRYFTLGHGGYFSPKTFIALTVPLEWNGRRGNLTYDLKAALGIQSFTEDGNALYPGFGSLQNSLQQVLASEPTLQIPRGYASQSNTGLGYALGGAAEYRLIPRLSLGGQFGVDNARNYRELQINGYLRYYFEEQSQLTPQAPTPILPIYGQ